MENRSDTSTLFLHILNIFSIIQGDPKKQDASQLCFLNETFSILLHFWILHRILNNFYITYDIPMLIRFGLIQV